MSKGSELRPKRGDHICAVYRSQPELAEVAATFIAGGLERRERSWYVASGDEGPQVHRALQALGIDVDAATRTGALRLISATEAYLIHGEFDPEVTLGVFNEAIEQACNDGFTGFRAAADMSWVLAHRDGPQLLIVYEALLHSLFSRCRATGLCLYDRQRMPLGLIGGALDTHPFVAKPDGGLAENPLYDVDVVALRPTAERETVERLAVLERAD